MRKVIAILLSCVLVFASCLPTAAAVSTCKINVTSASGARNDMVNVNINISANSAVQACGIVLHYDKSVLEVVSATKGEALSSNPIVNTNQLGKISLSYAATTPIKNSGSILCISFKIKSNAAYGDSALTLEVTELSDGSFNAISATVNSGKVNVMAPVLNAPAYVDLIEVEDTYASIQWDGVADATGYNVYLNGELFNEEPLLDNACTFYALSQDTEYHVEVTALHYDTESDKSSVCIIQTVKTVYSVTFVDWNYATEDEDESSILEIVYVENGGSVECSKVPYREGYRFIGWDQSCDNITEHKVVQAQYEPIVCTVTFVDWDNTVISEQMVSYGGAAQAPVNPSRDGYVFTTWNKTFNSVTEDTIVQAQYEKITCMHSNTEIQGKEDSTCVSAGFAGNVVCSDCGEVVSAGSELDLAPHNYEATITKPTPTAQGYTTHTCSVCGDSYVDNYVDYVDENAPQIVVSEVRGVAGNRVAVDISFKNNPGVAATTFKVHFDDTALNLVEVQDKGVLGSATHKPEKVNPYTMRWANNTATQNYTVNGVIATLVFEIKEGAGEGTYPISVTYDYDNFDIMDWQMNKVKFTVVNGSVAVVDVVPGDVNGDGNVDNRDAMFLDRYLADWDGYTEENVNLVAADVNGDGKVNNLDSMILARHLADWSGYETLPYVS